MTELYMRGPLHPDLFGPDTPIMEKVKLGEGRRAYRVTVSGYCWDSTLESRDFFVVGAENEAAAESARQRWADYFGDLYEEVSEDPDCEVEDITETRLSHEVVEKLQQSLEEAA